MADGQRNDRALVCILCQKPSRNGENLNPLIRKEPGNDKGSPQADCNGARLQCPLDPGSLRAKEIPQMLVVGYALRRNQAFRTGDLPGKRLPGSFTEKRVEVLAMAEMPSAQKKGG